MINEERRNETIVILYRKIKTLAKKRLAEKKNTNPGNCCRAQLADGDDGNATVKNDDKRKL